MITDTVNPQNRCFKEKKGHFSWTEVCAPGNIIHNARIGPKSRVTDMHGHKINGCEAHDVKHRMY